MRSFVSGSNDIFNHTVFPLFIARIRAKILNHTNPFLAIQICLVPIKVRIPMECTVNLGGNGTAIAFLEG